jgi:hypothetical protein
MAGLQSKSKRPKKTPEKKVTEQVKQWILELRQRRLGSRRIQSELQRLYDYSLSRRALSPGISRAYLFTGLRGRLVSTNGGCCA